MEVIDTRGMPPPEPFEMAIEALGKLAAGERLTIICDREPRPLFKFLHNNHYGYETTALENHAYSVQIWEL